MNKDLGHQLIGVIRVNNLKEVKRLIEEVGVDINCRVGLFNVTPLYRSYSYNRLEIAEYLIRNGADCNDLEKYMYIELIREIRLNKIRKMK